MNCGRFAGLRPNFCDTGKAVADDVDFEQMAVEFGFLVIMLPAAALAKLDEMRPATLRKREPLARDGGVGTWLSCRH